MQAESARDGEARGPGQLPTLTRLATHHQPATGAHRGRVISLPPPPPSVTLAWVTVCVTFYVGSVCVHSHVHVEYLTHWPSQCLWSGQQFWTRTRFNFSLDKLLVVASKSSTQPAAIYIVVRRWRDWKVSVVQLCEEFVTSDRSAIVCILQQVGWFHWSGIFIREKICNNANWIQRKEKKTPQKINREKLVNRIQI